MGRFGDITNSITGMLLSMDVGNSKTTITSQNNDIKVGIGTTDPLTMLHVNGSVLMGDFTGGNFMLYSPWEVSINATTQPITIGDGQSAGNGLRQIGRAHV